MFNQSARVLSKDCFLKGFIWNKQDAVAPKRTWGPLILLFPNLSSYNIKNQLAKFEKNLSVGSISVE